MRVAIHVDQLSAKVPGGIGTYIANLVPALADLPDTDITLFHCRDLCFPVPDPFPQLRLREAGRLPQQLHLTAEAAQELHVRVRLRATRARVRASVHPALAPVTPLSVRAG